VQAYLLEVAPGAGSMLVGLVLVLPFLGGAAAAAEPLTLGRAIAIARERSPRLAAAAALVHGAEGAARAAGRLPNPAVELRTENWQPHGGGPLPDHFALLSIPLPVGGRLGAERALADAELGVAGEDRRETSRRMLLDVAARFVGTVGARGLVATLREQRDGLDEAVRILGRRVDEGVAPGSDLAKIEAELGRLDLAAARAALAMQQAADELAVALGAASPVEPATLVEPAPLPLPAGDPATLVAEALERRPDIAAARARLARARRALALERSRAVPDISVEGGWKRTDGENTGVFALAVPLPLSDRNQGAIARAAGEAEAAARELAAVEAEGRAEARSALAAAVALAARAAGAEHALVAPADVVRRAARSALREGGGDVLRLVDAERVATDARREALELRLEAVLAAIRARVALGEEGVE